MNTAAVKRDAIVLIPACSNFVGRHPSHTVQRKYADAVFYGSNCTPLFFPAMGSELNVDVLLDNVRGKGQYIGTFLALTTLERYWWGEGEMKFFLDGDEEFPTVTSTGAEDYFGGAWAFLDRPPHALPEAQCFNTLFAGYPYRSTRDATRDRFSAGKPNPNPMLATNDDALPRHGLYRWHLPDPISFKEDLRVTFQDLGNDDIKLYEREDDISTVAYWYQSEPHAVLAPFAARQDRVPR